MNFSYKNIVRYNHMLFVLPDHWSQQSIAYFLGRLAQCQLIDTTNQPTPDDKFLDKNRVYYTPSHSSGVSMTPQRERVYDHYEDAKQRSIELGKQS